MYIGIKDGKVWDKVTELINKRGSDIADKDYKIAKTLDICIDDTWNILTDTNNKDSPRRFEEPEKEPWEIKIEELQSQIDELKKNA